MLKWSLMFLVFFNLGCRHEQQLHISTDGFVAKDTEEKDPKKLVLEAVTQGDIKRIGKLIDAGVDVNTRNSNGQTLLIMSVENQRYAVIDYLMSRGADPELTDDDGKNAFNYADGIIVDLLNREELSEDKLNLILAEEAINLRKQSLVEWLFSKGADPNFLYRKKPPLILAVTQRVSGEELGKLFGVIRLIVSHPKIDLNLPLRGKPLLTVAIAEARKRNYGQIEVFLESFAN